MRQLRRFVGMIAFNKKFIPKCAKIMQPIYALLSPQQRYSKKAVLWNDEAEKALHEIITKISSPITLASKMHRHTLSQMLQRLLQVQFCIKRSMATCVC